MMVHLLVFLTGGARKKFVPALAVVLAPWVKIALVMAASSAHSATPTTLRRVQIRVPESQNVVSTCLRFNRQMPRPTEGAPREESVMKRSMKHIEEQQRQIERVISRVAPAAAVLVPRA